MKYYKYSNKRIVGRDNKGRFYKLTLEDLGIGVNTTYLVCQNCGYGEKERWMPVLATGKCPDCGNQKGHKEKEYELSERAGKLIEEIEELKDNIGGVFIDPLMYNTHKDELNSLKYKLNEEIHNCIEISFDSK